MDDDEDDDDDELDFSLRCDELEECLERSLDLASRDEQDLDDDDDSGCLLLREGFSGASTTPVSTAGMASAGLGCGTGNSLSSNDSAGGGGGGRAGGSGGGGGGAGRFTGSRISSLSGTSSSVAITKLPSVSSIKSSSIASAG